MPQRQQRAGELAGELPPAARHQLHLALRMINNATSELAVVHRQLVWIGNHQPGCQAIRAIYGIGELVAPIVWAELGDVRRFSSSRDAVRHTGLDITVYDSDGKRAAGHLARQGPGALRWALFEAGKVAAHRASPDHHYYEQVKARVGHTAATLSVARKLVRRCYHTLGRLGDDALVPPAPSRGQRPADIFVH